MKLGWMVRASLPNSMWTDMLRIRKLDDFE